MPVEGWDQFEVARRVMEMVDVGATIKTDGMGGFNHLADIGYTHIQTISTGLGEDEYISPVLLSMATGSCVPVGEYVHSRPD